MVLTVLSAEDNDLEWIQTTSSRPVEGMKMMPLSHVITSDLILIIIRGGRIAFNDHFEHILLKALRQG